MASTIPFLKLAIVLVFVWCCYIVAVAVFDVFFGPLSRFPGPKLAAATRWVASRHKLGGTEHLYLRELHLRYGPIVRVGPKELSFIDSRAWKDINGRFSGVYAGVRTGQLLKDPAFYGFAPPGYLELLNANDSDHARMRRNFSHAFSDKALRQQEPLIRKYIDQLAAILTELAKNPGNKVDLVKYLNWTTFDIMSDLCSGEPLGCLTNSNNHPWVSIIFDSFKILPFIQEVNHYPSLAKVFQYLTPRSAAENMMIIYENAKGLVEKRLTVEEDRTDLLGIAMNAKEEYRLTKPELYGNTRLFMTAGTETTAALVSGLMFYLLQDSRRMSELVQEVRNTYSSPDEMSFDNLSTLSYLNACIDEGLRLYPPVAGPLPRITPKGGVLICEEHIPEDVLVYVQPYAANHSPLNFKEPDSFRPERWLGDAQYADDDRNVAQPFSVGPRNCIGKNLAYLEMRALLATIVWHFDVSLHAEGDNWLDQKTYLGWERHPLPVNLKLHVSS